MTEYPIAREMPKSDVPPEEVAYKFSDDLVRFCLNDQNLIIKMVIEQVRKRISGLIEDLEQQTKSLHGSIQDLPKINAEISAKY